MKLRSGWRSALTALGFLLAWVPTSPAQDLSTKITHETSAVYLPELLKALSEKSGVSLLHGANLRDDVLILRAKDVTLRDLMDRIGQAVGAEWQTESRGYRLVRTTAIARAEEQASLQLRRAKLRAAMVKLAQEAKRQDEDVSFDLRAKLLALAKARTRRDSPEAKAAVRALDALPGARLARGVALGLDVNLVAGLEQGDRVVFSSRPLPLQRPMPAAMRQALTRFGQEVRELQAALEALTPADREQVLTRLDEAEAGRIEVDKALVILEIGDAFGYSSIGVYLADAQGRVVLSNYADLSPDSETEVAPQEQTVTTGDRGEPVNLSPVSQEVIRLARRLSGEEDEMSLSSESAMESPRTLVASQGNERGADVGAKDRPQLSPTLLAALLNPEKTPFDHWLTSDVLLQWAASRERNLVAMPSSLTSVYVIGKLVEGATRLGDVTAGFNTAEVDAEVREESGWLILRPKDPFTLRQGRIDPRAAGRLVRNVHRQGRADLDSLAAVAMSSRSVMEALPYLLPLTLLLGDVSEVLDEGAWPLLRLYGSLTSLQRQTLTSGGALTVSNLTPAQQQLLLRWVTSNQGNLTPRKPELEAEEDADELLISSENTEAFPHGLRGDMVLRMPDVREPTIYIRMGSPEAMPLSADVIARILLGKATGESADPVRITEFAPGTSRELRFSLQIDARWVLQESLSESFGPMGWVKSWEQLPPEYTQAIRAALEAHRKAKPDPAPR